MTSKRPGRVNVNVSWETHARMVSCKPALVKAGIIEKRNKGVIRVTFDEVIAKLIDLFEETCT